MKPVNASKLPNIIHEPVSATVQPGHQQLNPSELAAQKRQIKIMVETSSQERPGSGRSDATRLTGGLTGAFTQVSAKTKSSVTHTRLQADLDAAVQQLSQPGYQLVNFIKYDTTLGREQNIEIAKESSLANSDRILMKGGVKLTRFRPEKPLPYGATTTIEETEESGGEAEKEVEDES